MKNLIRHLLGKRNDNQVAPLSLEEKESLRDEFWRFMDANPLPSPQTKESRSMNWFAFPAPQLAAIVLLVSAGGTAYLAEGAGPRDEVLYAVKRNVNEGFFKSISSFSPEFRAEVDKALLSRRFVEIEELMVDQQINSDYADMLRVEIASHTEALNRFVTEAKSEEDIEAAVEVNDDLVTLLDAHNTVIYIIDNLVESPNEEQIDLFVAEIADGRTSTHGLRQALSHRLTDWTPEKQERQLSALQEELEEATNQVEEAKASDDTSSFVSEEIDFLVVQSHEAKSAAEEALASGDLVTAIIKMGSAAQNMEKAAIVLSAYKEATE